jgi:hypothetical protein
MYSRKTAEGILAAFAVALLLGGNGAFAQSSQSLSMSVVGTVVQSGDQHYYLHGNGLVSAQIGTLSFGPSSKIDYTLTVDVAGQTAKGTAHFQIGGHGDEDHNSPTVTGNVKIIDMASEKIPFGCVDPACNSAIPVFFIGVATVSINAGHSDESKSQQPQTIQTGIMLESPYFNPFGSPLSIVSTDSPTAPSVVIVTTYDKATIDWTNAGVSGTIAGTLGQATVSGTFNLVMHESEDLVAGKSIDKGAIAFTNMNPTTLNANGKFSGVSLIPNPATTEGKAACALEEQASLVLTGAVIPCTADCTNVFLLYGLPAIPGTCITTGYQSDGRFSLTSGQQGQKQGDQSPRSNDQSGQNDHGSQGLSIDGTYSTTWTSPALEFLSSSTAAVSSQHGNSGDD